MDDNTCRCCVMMQKVDKMKNMLNQKLTALEADLASTQQVYNNLTSKEKLHHKYKECPDATSSRQYLKLTMSTFEPYTELV